MSSLLRPLQSLAKKLIVAGSVLAVSLPAGWAQKAQDSFRYRARLAAPVSSPRDVAADGFLWSCKGGECIAKSAVPGPAVAACSALAAQAGRIISFGNEAKSLGPAALAQCAKRALAGKPPVTAPSAQSRTLNYRAGLASPVLSPRDVASAGIIWSCKGNECFARSSIPNPTVIACAALGAKVGRIISFGNDVNSLGPAALQQCAKRVAIANRNAPLPGPKLPPRQVPDVGKIPDILERPPLPPIAGKEPAKKPPPDKPEPPLKPAEPGIIDTAALVLRGSDELPRTAAPFIAVTVSTGVLRIEGGALVPAPIDTPGLSLIGE